MATYKHLRSSTANKRPTTSIADGQIAINTNTASPGLFFKDSAGTGIVKVGPVHVGTTAPNVSPAAGGSSGNYTGEQWLDTSVSPNQMKVWNGSAWVGIVADELPVSKLQDGAARQLIQTDAAGTGVEWTSNIDLPGTLDVTGAATLDSTLSVAGNVSLGATATLTFEGATDDAFETTLSVTDPTADRSIVLPNVSGTVVTTGDSGTVTSAMIADGTIVNGDVNASAAIAGTKISPDFGGQTVTTTGVVSIAAGTAGAPSLAITGDTNTGLHSPGADQLAISTGGTGRVFVASDGKVGIGASSPATTLEVQNSTSPIIRVGDGTRHVQVWGGSTTQSQAIGTASAASFNINVNSSPVATFDTSGRLLVGTSTARDNLYNQNYAPIVQIESTNSLTGRTLNLAYNNAGASGGAILSFATSRGSASGSNTVVANNDELGTIHFLGADGTRPIIGASINAYVDGTPGNLDMPGRLVFSTTADGASSPTERMRIGNDGRVFVACTSSPSASVFGTMLSNNLLTEGNKSSVNTTSANVHWVFFNPNGAVGSISTSGSATSFTTSSDYRLKENIIPVTNGITRLQQLKPSRFNFIADPAKTVDGFIAHEVQTVVPEAITGEKDAVNEDGDPIYQGIDQSKLVPLLTAALQEAVAKIESLEARLTAAGI